MTVHQAFQSLPTKERGVLSSKDLSPLALMGSVLETEVLQSSARVTLRLEYRNCHSAPQDVFAAWTIPEGWAPIAARADNSTGSNFVLSQLVGTEKPFFGHYELQGAPAAPVATLEIPWTLMVGQCVVVQITYLATFDGIRLVIPRELFPPSVPIPDTAAPFRNAFVINAPPKLKPGVIAVKISGSSFLPNAEPPVLEGLPAAKSSLRGEPRSFDVTFEEAALNPAQEYVLALKPLPMTTPLALQIAQECNTNLAAAEDTYAITLAISPTFTAEQMGNANAEFIFVVAVGNGAGAAELAQVRRALQLTIHGLPPSCNVNIVSCAGNDAKDDRWMAPESLPVTASLLSPGGEVDVFTSRLAPFPHISATGSSNAEAPMKRPMAAVREIIGSLPFIQGLARNIVVITTDGGDKQALSTAQLVAANRHSTSVSTIALNMFGTADTEFLAHIAKASGGEFVLCPSFNTLPDALVAAVSNLTVPALTNVTVTIADAAAATADPHNPPTIRLCGHLPQAAPIARHGTLPTIIHAFADASVRAFTATVEGLVGGAMTRYVLNSERDIAGTADKNNAVKNDALTASLAHVCCARERIAYLVNNNEGHEEAQRLAEAFGVPCHLVAFQCRADRAISSRAFAAPVPHPARDHRLGRGAALLPGVQQGRVCATSVAVAPFLNVAVSQALARYITVEESSKLEVYRAARLAALARLQLKDRAQQLTEDEAVVAQRSREKLEIAALANEVGELLQARLRPTTTYDYMLSVVRAVVASVTGPTSAVDLPLCQSLDGGFAATNGAVLSALGLTTAELKESVPMSLSSHPTDEALDMWATALALTQLSGTPGGLLAVKKGQGFLLAKGTDYNDVEKQALTFLGERATNKE